METSDGFPPIERPDARILVLGSLPGRKSIAEQQYYAHPQNVFWPIMREIFGIEGEYHHRCIQLRARQVALWDVLKSSERPGSLDSDIRMNSAQPNDFGVFFEQMFDRFVDSVITPRTVGQIGLPSTSPAYAAMSFSGKLSAWRNAFLPLLEKE